MKPNRENNNVFQGKSPATASKKNPMISSSLSSAQSNTQPQKPPKNQVNHFSNNSSTKQPRDSSLKEIPDKQFVKDFSKEVNRLKNILEEKKKAMTEPSGTKKTKKNTAFPGEKN